MKSNNHKTDSFSSSIEIHKATSVQNSLMSLYERLDEVVASGQLEEAERISQEIYELQVKNQANWID